MCLSHTAKMSGAHSQGAPHSLNSRLLIPGQQTGKYKRELRVVYQTYQRAARAVNLQMISIKEQSVMPLFDAMLNTFCEMKLQRVRIIKRLHTWARAHSHADYICIIMSVRPLYRIAQRQPNKHCRFCLGADNVMLNFVHEFAYWTCQPAHSVLMKKQPRIIYTAHFFVTKRALCPPEI
jgi:hypothetical protein